LSLEALDMDEDRSGVVNTALVGYRDPVVDGSRYLTATEWLNGEGYDISLGGDGGQGASFALTHADVAALKRALARLEGMPPAAQAARPAAPAKPPRRAARLLDPA
jgi:hypothetical protein